MKEITFTFSFIQFPVVVSCLYSSILIENFYRVAGFCTVALVVSLSVCLRQCLRMFGVGIRNSLHVALDRKTTICEIAPFYYATSESTRKRKRKAFIQRWTTTISASRSQDHQRPHCQSHHSHRSLWPDDNIIRRQEFQNKHNNNGKLLIV